MENRITVKKAAELLRMSELTVRWGIINGTLPIGSYVKVPGSKRTNFHISRGLLEEYLKVPIETA